jgi:GNAT superfamily N-acetyltransferase
MMFAIRKADFKDFQAIIKIMNESTTDEEVRGFAPTEGISPKFLNELKNELKRLDHGVIIAEKKGTPVGFAYYTSKTNFVEIKEVDVIVTHQGQGIGRTLIQHIEKVAEEKGIDSLVTATSINKDGKPWKAYGFWVRMGFIDRGERIQGLHGLKYVKFIKRIPKA